MTIIDAIKLRKSVRSFDGTPLSPQLSQEIEAAIKSAYSPFGNEYTIRLKQFPLKGEFKPGTYGVIKNATDFLLMAIGENDNDALAAGYAMEQVVVRATQLGLGTCWIAATFKGSDFEQGISWPQGQTLRIVSPIGSPADKRSMLEKFTRLAIRSDNRKSFGRIFFDTKFDVPLSEDSTFGMPLQLMRLAPSSTNSQPWRALVREDTVHFYRASDKRIALLDTGIGLYHFMAGEEADGHSGEFHNVADSPQAPDKWIYVTSYTRNK